jgi:hypothetical protein
VKALASRRHGLAEFARVLRLLARRRGARWTARGAFETRRVLSVHGTPWRVTCAIHAVPAGTLRVQFQSSITLWPVTLRKRPGWKRGGWSAALRTKGWYRACEGELGQHGYRGRWQASPWGRFGDFWKPLRDAGAALGEMERLERLATESFGACTPASRTRARRRRRPS